MKFVVSTNPHNSYATAPSNSISKQQQQNNEKVKKGWGSYSSLWIGNPSQSYGASPAIWDHTVLPATRHRWTRRALTPAMQAGTPFTYPGGMEGWVDLGVGYTPRWFTCPQTVTHPGTNHLIATQPGVEPTTSRSQVQRPNRYTTMPPNYYYYLYKWYYYH